MIGKNIEMNSTVPLDACGMPFGKICFSPLLELKGSHVIPSIFHWRLYTVRLAESVITPVVSNQLSFRRPNPTRRRGRAQCDRSSERENSMTRRSVSSSVTERPAFAASLTSPFGKFDSRPRQA